MAAEQRKLLGKNMDNISLVQMKPQDPPNSQLSLLEKS